MTLFIVKFKQTFWISGHEWGGVAANPLNPLKPSSGFTNEFCVVGNLPWYSYCGSRFWFWTLLCWVSLSGDSDRFLQEQFSWIYSTTYSFPCWSSGQEWKKIHVNECIILKKKLNLLKQMIFPAYIRLRMKMTFSQFWHTIKKIIICTWHLFTFIWALQWDIPLFTTYQYSKFIF